VAVVPAARANPAAEPKGPVARRIGSFRDGSPLARRRARIRRNDNTSMKTIRLKEGKERSLLRRHPWIFDSAIARGGATPAKRCASSRTPVQFLAWAAFSPTSRIRARAWSFDEAAAH
jgi:hypothetical protein